MERYCGEFYDKQTQRDLVRKAQNGDVAARNNLVSSCYAYVKWIAKSYTSYGLPYEDLVSEGVLGLFAAVDAYDLKKYNVKFNTMAQSHIRVFIQRAIQCDTLVHLPQHLWAGMKVVKKPQNKPFVNHKYIEDFKTRSDFYNSVLQSKMCAIDISIFRNVFRAEVKGIIADVMIARLSDTEKDILIRRYGLDGRPRGTLANVASIHSLSRERIRQIEERAVKKISRRIKKKLSKDVLVEL